MKPSRVFPGVFLVALGAILLIGRSYDLDFGLEYIWKLWPVAIILIGLAVMLKSQRLKWIIAAAAALLLALAVYGFFTFGWLHWRCDTPAEDEEAVDVQEFSEAFIPTIRRATFQLDAAAGKFYLDTTSDGLLTAKVNSSIGRYKLERTSTGDEVTLHLQPEGDVRINNWRLNHSMNRVDVKLNATPVWNMTYEIGAATAELDLSMLQVERLRIEAGAASVRLKLGMHPEETHVNLEAGASSIKLSIPDSAGCEIKIDEGLSSTRFEDFEKISDDTYRTKNFKGARRKIFVDAETGVSSIRVTRY